MTITFGSTPAHDPPTTDDPWVWVGDDWVLVATDTGDEIPESLELDTGQEKDDLAGSVGAHLAGLEVTSSPAVILKNRPNVELLAAGTWSAVTGRTTFTRDDLASAVAAMDCPGVRNPVLKLGHDEADSGGGIRWDGEPAIGWVANMRLDENGGKIVGDFMGMPAWLDDVLPSAYPSRSVEIWRPFTCQIGHNHPAVITAVAMLGVSPPGVGVLKSLQDVQALYTTATAAPSGRTALGIRVGDDVVYATADAADPAAPVRVRISGSRPGRYIRLAFNPNQPRDPNGKWGDGVGLPTDRELLKDRPWADIEGREKVYGDEAELSAWRLLESYSNIEVAVTPALKDIAARNGGRMEGLDFRLKTQESLARKLEQKSAAKGLTVQEYGPRIGDALRYTMVASENDYAKASQDAIDDFRRQGYTVEVENTWTEGATYKGINTNVKKDGLIFEVQFHSEGSLALKNKQHPLYEVARKAEIPPTASERAAATAQMIANAAAIATPADIVKVR